MCGPFGAILGGVVGAIGSIYQGQAQAAQYKAQKRAAQYQAQAERDAGRYEAGRLGEQGDRLRGNQIVGYADEGLQLSGSVAEVISDSRTEIALDQSAIRTNSENRAKVSDYEAKIAAMNAKSAKTAGMIGAVGAVIGGATSAANMIMGGGGGGGGGSVGSAFTSGGLAPKGLGAPIPQPRPVASSGISGGNIPTYGYSYYGGPR